MFNAKETILKKTDVLLFVYITVLVNSFNIQY